MVVYEVLAGENEGVGVGGVGYGVEAGGLFAGGGFGAGGFLGILAGCEFAFVELIHNSRIARGCKGSGVKLLMGLGNCGGECIRFYAPKKR